MKHTTQSPQLEFQFNPLGPNPSGKCMCGCGGNTPISKLTDRRCGYVKGTPVRFIRGHHLYKPIQPNEYAPWVAQYGLSAPYGECQCGCGKPAPIARRKQTRVGIVNGHPYRFHVGHNPKPIRYQSAEAAFLAHVTPGEPDECWIWRGFLTKGYGRVQWNGSQRTYLAHHVSWEIHFGPIPDNLHVLHKCDNPPCVNPNHLFLGTPAINAQDKVAKGRQTKGEASPKAKLTEADVREIRRLAASGVMLKDIAPRFNVADNTISYIVARKSWRWLE